MDKYAIFGNPVEHSLSPIIHEIFAEQAHQKLEYIRIKPPLDGFEPALQEFIKAGGNGCNVTFPFKGQAFNAADQCSNTASDAEAASCLLIRKNGTIFADNYDGTGLVEDLTHNYEFPLSQKKILIIGSGGATRGILGPLLDMAPSRIIIANRTPQKAMDLAERYKLRGYVTGIGFDDIEVTPYDLIIHATTAGHQGNLVTLPEGIIGHRTCCYDLSYGKAAEPFLQWAKKIGAAQCIDGLGMLVEHNAAVFYLWRNIYPDTKPVIEFLRHHT
ncbi:shikimate dehydrogenase [Candidiatus Paracoxiella cheracis]|uniref:shikimate dehydrogenase n=1 Tax=Candidiatus Paracoxiella cheracis TaxID=3405120 RepID=UPI003BF4CF41